MIGHFKWADLGDLLDQIICCCGWQGDTFYDNRQYAYRQWQQHLTKECHVAHTVTHSCDSHGHYILIHYWATLTDAPSDCTLMVRCPR